MELLMATAAEAADILRASRSWVYRLIPAKPLESIKGGRSRRISVASIHNVAAERAGAELVEASTERSDESAPPGKAQEVGDVLSA